MKKYIFIIFFITVFTTAASLLSAENYLYHRVFATALVNDPERTSEEITAWVRGVGGYYTLKSSDRVILRIPEGNITKLKKYLEENAEDLIEYIPSADDVREEILFLQSAIDSREEILRENLEYLDKTDVSGTLAIEQEVLSILKELEDLKGRLKMLNRNRAYAYAEIALSFQSQSLPEQIPSSFPWLAGLDFYSFIERGFE